MQVAPSCTYTAAQYNDCNEVGPLPRVVAADLGDLETQQLAKALQG